MSWAEAAGSIGGGARRWRAIRSVSFALFAGASLAACGADAGFRPMYGTSSLGGSNVNEKLAKIEIAPIPGRVGQRIRNELIFTTTGGGAPLPPEYRLEVVIKETLTSTLVRKDGEAQGTVYNLDAKFRLIKIADKAVVLEGASYGRAAFERFKSVFANVRAREDAENRAAETIGTELKGRLAAYLAGAA
jgi:LPS-assembly lipoprotein